MTTVPPSNLKFPASPPRFGAMAILFLVSCIRSPHVDPNHMTCRTDDNCLIGYSCFAGTCQVSGNDSVDRDAALDHVPFSPVDVAPRGGDSVSFGGPDTGGTVDTRGSMIGTGDTANPSVGVISDAPLSSTNCPQPTDPTGGSVLVSSLMAGGTATYSCRIGYSLSGGALRTCQADGKWNGSTPTCLPVDCGPAATPVNGKVSVPTTTYQATATYSCDVSFAILGDQFRTCQSNGTWSGSPPTCEDIQTLCDGAWVNLKTDKDNCGKCGNRCTTVAPSTAQCTSSRCLVTLATADLPNALTIDSTNVYWTDTHSGKIMKVPISGGAATTIATGQDSPERIVVDSTSVYWTDWNLGTVMQAPLSGGPAVPIATGGNAPCGIAVDATNVYWGKGGGYIMKLPKNGGTPISIASRANNCGLAVDANSVYWFGILDHAVMKSPLLFDGTSTTLAPGPQNPTHLLVDNTSVYWANRDDGTIMKAPIGGGPVTTLASGITYPVAIALDATNVYFGANFRVMKVSLSGGTPVTLVSGLIQPLDIAVDATSIYITSNRTNTAGVFKLTPK